MTDFQNGVKIERLSEIVKGKYGYYNLIERTDACAIYSKDKPISCYEVFFVKKIDPKKAAEFFNKRGISNYDLSILPDLREKYPKDEDFGKSAWTYKSLEKAKEKFEELKKQEIIQEIINKDFKHTRQPDCPCGCQNNRGVKND